jgi:hypothetical protein
VTLIVLLAGCGSNNAPTKARALSYAKRVDLRAGDVPGDRAIGHGGEFFSVVLGGAINSCGADLSRSDARAVAISPMFIGATAQKNLYRESVRGHLYSVVYVMKSDALAKRAVDALGEERTRACLEAHPPRDTIGGERAAPLTVGLSASAIRRTETIIERTGPIKGLHRFVIDEIGFARGPAVVDLLMTSDAGAPPAKTEKLLTGLLLRRAEQQRL